MGNLKMQSIYSNSPLPLQGEAHTLIMGRWGPWQLLASVPCERLLQFLVGRIQVKKTPLFLQRGMTGFMGWQKVWIERWDVFLGWVALTPNWFQWAFFAEFLPSQVGYFQHKLGGATLHRASSLSILYFFPSTQRGLWRVDVLRWCEGRLVAELNSHTGSLRSCIQLLFLLGGWRPSPNPFFAARVLGRQQQSLRAVTKGWEPRDWTKQPRGIPAHKHQFHVT